MTGRRFGTDFEGNLVLIKDHPDAAGRWQIVTKAHHVHAGRGLPPRLNRPPDLHLSLTQAALTCS